MNTSEKLVELPNTFVIIVGVLCLVPFFLISIGVDIAANTIAFDPSEATLLSHEQLLEAFQRSLSSIHLHTILEWTAASVAMLTSVLAFLHYSMTRNITTPIIGIALFFVGTMDIFHVLAVNQFIDVAADHQTLVAFTWALSRLFNALILILAAGLFTGASEKQHYWESQGGIRLILVMSFTLATIAFMVIWMCANSPILPKTYFPDSTVPHPWDAAALMFFLIAGISVYPRFYKQNPSIFSHALMLSTVPMMASQVYAAFGSVYVFDNYFVGAQLVKILGYGVLLCGLLMDYGRTYQESEQRAFELASMNEDLEQFAYAASHDLQEPLRKISNYAQLLGRRYEGRLDEDADRFIKTLISGSTRMRALIQDLLKYSRIGREEIPTEEVNLSDVYKDVLGDLETRIEENEARVSADDLPAVRANPRLMHQLLQNLVGNALKYRGEEKPVVHIGAKRKDKEWLFSVSDNGIGIDDKYKEKVFGVFQRLHGRDSSYSGTGIGLALCKKIVDQHHGRIWVESKVGEGSVFYFTIPRQT